MNELYEELGPHT